ncbi:hypothetical protein AVEN_145929-1 [Araneus ventricosus]|uniref:Uncharacterized protein n=1 Tax=Araneus ventricosus TaxID=182803 RepID=A0A4Y2GL48_ARAVE|nr:hypothetical protein AVEN_145929-1 [Araneus ventricosus]
MAVGDGSPGVCSGGPAKCSFAGLQLRGKFLVAPRQSVLRGQQHVSGGPARCSFAGLQLRVSLGLSGALPVHDQQCLLELAVTMLATSFHLVCCHLRSISP